MYCFLPDRKKDLVKLQGGEYVSLGKVESQLKTCPIIDNICIYGNSFKAHTVALIVPNQPHLFSMAVELGIEDPKKMNLEELYANKRLVKMVLDELTAHGQSSKSNTCISI